LSEKENMGVMRVPIAGALLVCGAGGGQTRGLSLWVEFVSDQGRHGGLPLQRVGLWGVARGLLRGNIMVGGERWDGT
jgi:hypothetical protein